MFQVLVREKKRRTISPLFIGASVAAHVLVFGGVIYAASGETAAPPTEVIEDMFPIAPVERPVEKPTVEEPKPVEQDQPVVEKPVVGETVVIPSPTVIPDRIAPPSATETPLTPDMVTGVGKPGDVIGTPDPEDTRPATGENAGSDDPAEEIILTPDMVEELPRLDQAGLARILERNYPPMLRDARMNGRVVVELVVDRDGRVRPESARIVESSHPAFADATLRAVERFRFRPAKIGGMVVPVKVSIPIVWTAVD